MKNSLFLVLLSILFFGCNTSEIENNSESLWEPGNELGKPLKTSANNLNVLVNATVHKMVEFNNVLYVGGDFETIGGQVIKYLAKWGGNNWSSIGNLLGPVEDMIEFQGKLYLQVNVIQNQQIQNLYNTIYCWDGSSLYQVQGNLNGTIGPLYTSSGYEGEPSTERWTIHDNKLFVFAKLSDISWNGQDFFLYWWDGGQYWNSDWDFNMYHGVLKSFQGKLYCTKRFYNNNDELGLFRFNGNFNTPQQVNSSWEKVSGNTLNPPKIYTLEVFNNNLIVGGAFETMGGLQLSNNASYNGTTWSAIGNWPYKTYEFKVFNNKLYGSFMFNSFNGFDAERIACLNGNNWDSLLYNLSVYDSFADGQKNTIQLYQNYLYLGGNNNDFQWNNFVKLKQ